MRLLWDVSHQRLARTVACTWVLGWFPVLVLAAVPFLLSAAAYLPGSPARAQEPDSTTGTASTISPSTVAAGGTLRYTLSGFPAGAPVEVLLDDVDTQVLMNLTVGQDGTASGTVELPKLIGLGPHWLRFRTKTPLEGAEAETAGAATRGPVSNKSPFFTVGEVTIIGSSSGQKPPAASDRPATASPQPVLVGIQGARVPLRPLLLGLCALSGLGVLGLVLLRRRRGAAGSTARRPGAAPP